MVNRFPSWFMSQLLPSVSHRVAWTHQWTESKLSSNTHKLNPAKHEGAINVCLLTKTKTFLDMTYQASYIDYRISELVCFMCLYRRKFF